MATVESACPIPGHQFGRILPSVDNMENIDGVRREEAEPFLKTDIRFMSARNVKLASKIYLKNSSMRSWAVNSARTTSAAQCRATVRMKLNSSTKMKCFQLSVTSYE